MREGSEYDDFEALSAYQASRAGWREAYDRWISHIDQMTLEQIYDAMKDITIGYNPNEGSAEFWARIYNALEERKYWLEHRENKESAP